MSKNTRRSLDEIEIDGFAFFIATLKVILVVGMIWFVLHFFFVVYKPKEKAFIKGSKMAYSNIEEVANEYFKLHGALFKDPNALVDDFCNVLADKFGKNGGNCKVAPDSFPKENFVFKGTDVTVYGMERKPFDVWGTPSKDILIDINGQKGENMLGVDRVIVRLHSTGRMGGLLAPVSCDASDKKDYDVTYSPMCPNGVKHSFLTTNIPFGFDVIQIGGKNGKSRKIASNINFMRADCIAFGGEIVSADELCERRGWHWLEACYDEFPCEVELSK